MENRKKEIRWLVLFILLSTVFTWLLLINQAFAWQPKPDCKALPGFVCQNPLPVFAPGGNPPPTATPTSNIWGDAGDAPGNSMTAYTTTAGLIVTAGFPTIYVPGTQSGPYHRLVGQGAYLGQRVSKETNADQLPDDDGLTNIDQASDQANRDSWDDGLGWLEGLESPCNDAAIFTYTVTIEAPNTIFYLNAWFDFDRNGHWDDGISCSPGVNISEWVVQNHPVSSGVTGTFTDTIVFTTTNFSGHLLDPLWVRLTLSEQPAAMANDGSGPAAGFLYGETEDYYVCRKVKSTPQGKCESGDPAAGWRG